MKKYGVVLFVIFLASCHPHYTQNGVILEAEKLLDTAPDSSFNLLSSITHPEKLSKADYAAWCLQYTHASYKLQKIITSDSIIRISVNYYKNSKLKKQSGTAFYLLGCVAKLLQKDTVAMEAYKEAENVLAPTNENKLKGLVQINLGYLCMHDEMYKNALSYFKNSLGYFNQSKNKKYASYAYRDISNMYNQLDYPFDSVMHYSALALKASKESGDSINYYNIMSRQGQLLYKRDYKQAKELILKGYHYFPSSRSYYAAYLSYLYLKLNQPESAKYYLKIALSDNSDSSTKLIALHAAALISEESKDYNKAYSYLEKGYLLRDSIYALNISDQLQRINKQYDLTINVKENTALKIANQTKIIWIALLAVVFLIILVLFLLIINKSKQKQAVDAIDKQRLKFSKETTEIQNLQKRELLLVKTQNKIDNTLAFNKLNRNLMTHEKKDKFLEEITKQSTLSEKDWPNFITEVDNLFESRISKLKNEFPELTDTDCVVIALICLKINISNSCLLLNMNKNTLYNRRKTIKIRIELNADTDLEKWILGYIRHIE
jgi:hypothetical protein